MATSPNFLWPEPDNTDLVKNGALAIRTAVDAIDSSMVDLKGGTTNQVLAKNSNTDMDFKWVADASGIPATILDAKGDLIAATAADTASRLAVGANGTVLTADSAEATGLKWATPASSASGLTLVSSTTFTAAATHSVNSCFTSTYRNYLILIEAINTSSGGDGFLFRLRASGTDATGSDYVRQILYFSGTTANAARGTATYLSLGGTATTSSSSFIMNLMRPNIAATTLYQDQGNSYATGSTESDISFGGHNVATAYDGFTIYSQGGSTNTGQVRVYGYQNS